MSPRPRNASSWVTLAVLLAMPVANAAPGDDPWPMAGRDATHSGSLDGPRAPYRRAWERTVGAGGPVAGPAVSAGAVVVVAVRAVMALDPRTGEVRWSRERSRGPAGVPAVLGDLLYHASGRGPAAALVARRLDDGREVWRAFTGSSAPGGATVSGRTVYQGTEDGLLLAFDARTGEESWRFETAAPVEAPPAVSDQVVLVTAQNTRSGTVTVHAVDSEDGDERWRFTAPRAVPATAVAATPKTVFVGLSDGRIVGVALRSGNVRWEASSLDAFVPGAVPAAGQALAIADRLHLYLLDPETGEERWTHRLADLRPLGAGAANTLSSASPAITGQAVLVADAAGLASAVDLRSGERIWKQDVSAAPVGPVALGPDAVYVAGLAPEGTVVALRHDPAGSLIAEVSPTVLFPLRALLGFAAAALLVGGLVLLLTRLLPAGGTAGTPSGPNDS